MVNSDLLKQILGDKYDPKADYVLEFGPVATARMVSGECKIMGEFLTEGDGPMIILERNPKPKPSLLKRVLGIERKSR